MNETLKQPYTRSVEFLQECWVELKKVHWPTRQETQAATIVVIIGVTLVGIYLGIVDTVLSWIIQRALNA